MILDFILNITIQSSGFGQNTVGTQQDVICSLSTLPNVDPKTITLGWVNAEDIATKDNRVTIENDFFNDSTPVTIIHFDPLVKEDEGEYICYTIINGSFIFNSIDLQNFTTGKQL